MLKSFIPGTPDLTEEEFLIGLSRGLAQADAIPIRSVMEKALLEDGAIGTGKTHQTLEAVNRSGKRTVILTKTVALAKENKDRLEAEGYEGAQLWLGRNYVSPEGEPACLFHEEATLIQDVGGKPSQLCVRKKNGKRITCEHYDECPIAAQHLAKGDTWLAAHAMSPHPITDDRPFDVTVYDEDPLSTWCVTETFDAAGTLQNTLSIDPLVEEIMDTLIKAAPSDGRLNCVNLPSSRAIKKLRRSILKMKCDVEVSPNPDHHLRKKIKKAASLNRPIMQAARFLEGLRQCMSRIGDDGTIHAIRAFRGSDGKILTEIAFDNGPHEMYDAPTLVLSATANKKLLQPWLPNIEAAGRGWDTPEHANFFRIPKAGAITSLVEGSELTRQGDELVTAIETLARLYNGQGKDGVDVLVVCQKALKELLPTHPRVDIENFGAVEGKDRWKGVACVFVVGRPLPPPEAFWMKAERIAGEVIPHPGEQWQKRWFADRSGYWLSDYCHDHPIMDALLRSTTHAAVIQADRSRALRRTEDNPVDVIFMNTVELHPSIQMGELPWERLSSWQAAMANKGVALAPKTNKGKNALIAALLPKHFSNPKAVNDRLQYRKADKAFDPRFPSPQSMKVRLLGARYWVDVLMDAEDRKSVRLLLGELLPNAEVKGRNRTEDGS